MMMIRCYMVQLWAMMKMSEGRFIFSLLAMPWELCMISLKRIHTHAFTPCLGNIAYQAYVTASQNQICLSDPNKFCHLWAIAD